MNKKSLKKILLVLSVILVFATLAVFSASAVAVDDGHTHVFTNYVYDDNASCTEGGTKTAFCDVCNIAYDTVADAAHPAKGHTPVTTNAVEATCYSTGLTAGSKCSVCKTVLTEQQTVAKKAHTYSTELYTVIAPTCTSTGAKAKKCTVCGAFELDNQEIMPMLKHDYKWTVLKNETCYADGLKKATCKVCGDTFNETIPAVDHTYGEWYVTVKPTCTEEGEEEHKCVVCGAQKTRPVEKAAHVPRTVAAIEATCEKSGRTEEVICFVCKNVLVAHEYVAPTGHDFYIVDDVTPATCMSTGVGHQYCTKCDYSHYVDLPNIDHVDANGDEICDSCGNTMKVQSCGCFCHYDTFVSRFARWINTLLSKLFNKEFACCDDMIPYTPGE